MTRQLIAISLLALFTASTRADLLVYEGFDYTPGSNVDETTLNGGTGWSGAYVQDIGNQAIEIEAQTLAPHGNLQTSGNQWRRTDTGDETLSRGISADLDDGNTELWFSLLFQANGTSNGGWGLTTAGFNGAFSNGTPNFLGSGESGFGFEVTATSKTLQALAWEEDGTRNDGNNYVLGSTTHLLAVQLIFGATDTVNIYDVGTDLAQGSVVSTVSGDVDEASLAFFAAGSKRQYIMDEIRVGTSFADVVVAIPEPASASLLLVALTFFAARRRLSRG